VFAGIPFENKSAKIDKRNLLEEKPRPWREYRFSTKHWNVSRDFLAELMIE
jgi:hypothetical protein